MKKTILFLLLLSLLLSLTACKDVDETTLAEQVFVDPGTEVLEEAEPEDNDPGLLVAIAAKPSELMETAFAQNLALPLMTYKDGSYHSHVIQIVGLGGNYQKLSILEGISGFTGADLAALLKGQEGLGECELKEDGTVVVLPSSEDAFLLEELLSKTYLADYGPYSITKEDGNTLLLEANPACPQSDCPCTANLQKRITLLCSISPEDQVKMLQEGSIDLAWDCTGGAENATVFRTFTGKETFLLANPASENNPAYVFFSLDRETLAGENAVPADLLFAPGFPGAAPAEGWAPGVAEEKPDSLTLCYPKELEALAKAIQSQLRAEAISVSLTDSRSADADLFLVEESAPSANVFISKLFQAEGEEGKTFWGLENADVLSTAALMGTVYGKSEENLRLFLDWMDSENPCVTGISAECVGSSLRPGLCGEYNENGLLVGSITEPIATP